MKQNNDMKKGVDAIRYSFDRHNIMADVNYYARIASLRANGFIYYKDTQQPPTQQSQLDEIVAETQNTLQKHVNSIQSTQFKII